MNDESKRTRTDLARRDYSPPSCETLFTVNAESIVIINPPGIKGLKGLQVQSPAPPIGLAYITAYLKTKQIPFVAIDACGENMAQVYKSNLYPDCLLQGLRIEEIIAKIPARAKIVGITCMFAHQWPLVREMGVGIKNKFPDVILVLGGEHPSAAYEDILLEAIFDCIVRGEGEETFVDLIEAIKNKQSLANVSGLAYRAGNKVLVNSPAKRIANIDALPWPDWESWNINNYILNNQTTGLNMGTKSIPILGSRGCPFSCTFCSSPQMWFPNYKTRNPKDLVDEMESYIKKYQVRNFLFQDLTFIVNGKTVRSFCEEIIRRGLKIKFQLPAGTRSEVIDQDLMELLSQAGLQNIALALESADAQIRMAIKKRVKLPNFIQALKNILKTKVTVAVFIVLGFPEDSRMSIFRSIRFLIYLAWLGVHDVAISKFTPYPGSEIYLRLKRQGKLQFNEGTNVIDFFSSESASQCEAMGSRELNFWMWFGYFIFFGASFLMRPWRLLKHIFNYLLFGVEEARYVKVFGELLFLRRKWKFKAPAS